MTNDEFMTKKEAVAYISEQTGSGRYAIERRLDEMFFRGVIIIEDDPADNRRKRIRKSDVEHVLQIFRGQV